MGLVFMNPLFIAAISAAAIPLIIHLIHQRRSRVVDFSSLKFLKLVDLKVARARRLKEILLMALRMSILALLALALARPVLTPKSAASAASASTSAVFILDDSYSMSASAGGSTVFARAVASLEKSLSTFSDGDQIAVIFLSSHDNSAAFFSKVTEVSGKLKTARPSNLKGNAASALEAAYAMLAKSTAPNKEIFIATDMQASLWKEIAAAKLPKFDKSVTVYLLDSGATEPVSNLALVGVTVGPGAKPGTSRVEAKVRNLGPNAQTAALTLTWDGARVREYSCAILPGSETLAVFEVENVKSGIHEGFAVLADDALPADNVRYFTTDRPAKKRLLLVDGAPSATQYQDEVFYLKYALDPGLSGTDSIFEIETVQFRNLEFPAIQKFSAVVLANVPNVPPPLANKLESFVRLGGALIVFPGDTVNFKNYENTIGRLLPGKILPPYGPVEDPGETGTFKLEPGLSHEALAPIAADAAALFGEVRFWRAFSLERKKGAGVIAGFSNSEDALLEWEIGKGRVVLAAFPADMDWSNLPVKKAFVPLMHQIVRFAAGVKEIKTEFSAGEKIRIQVEPGSASAVLPGGEIIQLGNTNADGDVSLSDTRETGVYKFSSVNSAETTLKAVAVNVDSAESALDRADEKALAAGFAPARSVVIKDPSEIPGIVSEYRHGIELFMYLLILALAAFIAECWLANTFAAKETGEQKPLDDLGRIKESVSNSASPEKSETSLQEAAK